MIPDARGIPLAVLLTGTNVNDVTQLQTLVEAIPPVRGKPGRPRRRPEIVQGDRGYSSEEHRRWLRAKKIVALLARVGSPHASGLGKTRWVVERTLAWLHHFRRLRTRWERRKVPPVCLACHRRSSESAPGRDGLRSPSFRKCVQAALESIYPPGRQGQRRRRVPVRDHPSHQSELRRPRRSAGTQGGLRG
ncbi:MAG: transposase [Gemmatimonadales bacterium]|nr:transposase [Gemmatimonadales bacterium]NIN49311.1 transposase [Gemmatimonadales bacterium]NIP06775.1 transposase [Gemmatimonadales bacterium]NIR02806.1 transposase [Gemmatimonadales bacterium]NIS66397.1 transposase [Gemmatimonadales bacterium]